MGRAISYELAGKHFDSQSALESAVKEYLRNTAPKDQVFQSRFLRDIVNTLHQGVMAAGQHSTGSFEFVTYGEQVRRGLPFADMYRGGAVMMTYFEPLGDWRDVTVYPWRKNKPNPRAEIVAALRIKVAALLPAPKNIDRCAAPGCQASGYGLRYHHIHPTFAEIADECLDLMNDTEVATVFGYSKFTPGVNSVADCIPDSHPAIKHLLWIHTHNEWVWLCEHHHVEIHELVAA